MPAINRIHICGFKAFPNDFELQLEGKNLLMYGENGSGKSSIYYALHCMFQAPLKPDAGKKYFDPASEQHLKNLNNLDADSKIWIDFDGRHPFIYNIDKEGYQFTLLGGKHPLPAQINGCFVNHQFLFHFFNFRNSQRINLFPVFIKDILPFCKDDNTGLHIGEMYDEITASIIKKGRHIHPDYISNIEYFNKAVKKVVEAMAEMLKNNLNIIMSWL
jgi:energy-coupling factor transporter ATP-binding protein EcfA2